MGVHHVPLQVTGPFNKKVRFGSSRCAHDIKTLLEQPMTNNRDLQRLIALFPVFAHYINKLKPGASIADLGCGQGVAALDLALLEKNFSVVGIDQQQPNDNLLSSPLLRHLGLNLESNLLRESIPDNTFDFIYSFFTSMYLKDPFTFLEHIHKKLAFGGTAFIHLGYIEQYKGGEQFLKDQLGIQELPSARLMVGNKFSAPLLPVDTEQPSVGNLSVLLHPVVIMFTKKDTFSLQPLVATQGVYFTYNTYNGQEDYQTPHSNLWYRYG